MTVKVILRGKSAWGRTVLNRYVGTYQWKVIDKKEEGGRYKFHIIPDLKETWWGEVFDEWIDIDNDKNFHIIKIEFSN